MRFIAISFVAVFSACVSLAQTTNNQSILGTVQDSSGAVVPNAEVTVVSQATNLTRSAVSNESGNYVISNLPIGVYDISATAPGFKKFVLTKVEVTVSQQATVNIALEIGNVNESVTVQADAVRVESSTGEVSNLITGTQASQIQLNGRNFPQLLQLLPGVSTTYSSGFGLFGGYGVNNSGQSINGSRTDTFSWYLDGADNKDNGGGGNNFVNINPDAIAEFRVLTANYSAEYGGSAGAVINIAVKGGTTDFHGIAYEFFRNDAIQARAFNALTIPELRFNNFGWNVGGPIYIPRLFNKDKSKLFFFVGQDFKRLRQGATNTWTVPTSAQRNGNFSALPVAQWPKDPLTGQVFQNGIVPSNRWSPNSVRLLNNYPLPNFSGSGGNFVFNTVAPLDTNQYLYKVDYNISSKNQLSVHYFRDYYTSVQNLTQLITYNRNIPGTNSSIQWTNVPNPTTVNVAQFTFTGNVIFEKTGIAPNPLFITDFTRAGQGITYPTIYNASNAVPSIQLNSFTSLTSTPLNFNNFNRLFDWKDDFSKILGNHDLKLGILIMRSRKNQDNVPAINGTFVFNTTSRPSGPTGTTGNVVADALLGNFYSYTEASSTRQGWYRFSQVEPYIQDNWKINERLTLNIGLRWAYVQPQFSALNNTTAFLPQYFNPTQAVGIVPKTGAIIPNSGNIYNGLVLGGTGFPGEAQLRFPDITRDPAVLALFHNLPKGTAYTDWNTWQPRLGFAYDLTGHQSTILRGGYGIFHERIEGNFIFSAVNNPPFVQQTLIYYGNVENPGGGTVQNFPSNINNSHYLDMKVPRTMNWSFGIQQKVGRDSLLDLSYVGSSAANLSYQQDINQLLPGTIQANPGVNVNALRPYPGYADIYQYNTGANFIYNSLQVQFRKQFTQGGLINVAYTWSKARTDANNYAYQPQNSYNLRGDWGPSSYNRNHILVISYVYPLPFWLDGRTWYQKVLGGWQISGVTTLQTGLPVNITLPSDNAGIGIGSGQRPNLVGDAYLSTSRTQYLNPLAFAIPAPGMFGNLGAYAVFLPFWSNWDASLQKAFPIGEHVRANFRAELYNFPQHFSYTSIGTTYPSGNFGQVTGATDPRTLQLALRVSF
ncbi:MAG: carboxypeptidase regulatory-like domain-containing protein [Acidobacteriaceae bacterium]|nr:carboxypeptidase regulatory-like domain-containing protein [Acidobacteriaceae bacterium]